MKISGFTIVRNAVQFHYPVIESIRSILPICDEFIVNVGHSDDATMELIRSVKDEKIRIIENEWDFSQGKYLLSQQTNKALAECRGDWAFYLQCDEVIHQDDLPRLKRLMQKYLNDASVDALRFQWLHFYGSYHRYRVDHGWFQKAERIVRNNGQVESIEDAYSFGRKDGKPLNWATARCLLYHYGWVQPEDVMRQRRINAEEIGFAGGVPGSNPADSYSYGDLTRFPAYFGSHPEVMTEKIKEHSLSKEDAERIDRKYWWHPLKMLKVRYKTGKRVRERIE